MDTVRKFRVAVESGDLDAAFALFADDIRLFSPVKYKPFEGIDAVRALFHALQRTFRDFRYVGEYSGRDGSYADESVVDSHVLHFRTVVAGKQIDGIDLLQTDDSGRITTITVMIRPLSSVIAVGEAVQRELVG